MTTASPKISAWLGFNVAALMASLAHTFIDMHVGLMGATSHTLSPVQAGTILLISLVIAWWSLSLATAGAGARPGLSSAFAMAVGWALLANGAAVIIAAPPPSPAFPYQDIAHFSSLIFGGLAAYTTWRELRLNKVATNWWFLGVAVALMVATFVLQAVLSLAS